MSQIYLRFYEELNDFLPSKRRKVEFPYGISSARSVKHVIETLGVPHTEIDLILVNQHSVDFSYIVQPGDRISVYPTFESFDISPLTRHRPKPLRDTRFVLDTHLGKLAIYLRFAGFDTLYRNNYSDDELARISAEEHRILLTRDRELLKRRIISHGCYVRTTNPKEQLTKIFQRLHLALLSPPKQRCTSCNALLQPIAKEKIIERLQPDTRTHYQEFYICADCDKIYWKGSHYQKMLTCLQDAMCNLG
jgi:uncharacterized protein with PIN domain